MPFPNLLAWVVLVAVPLNLVSVLILVLGTRQNPKNRVLRHDAITAVVVLLQVIVFGLIFVNNDTVPPPLPTEWTKLITRLTLAVLAYVPALLFIGWYLFNGHDEP
jgi:amino acid transporter